MSVQQRNLLKANSQCVNMELRHGCSCQIPSNQNERKRLKSVGLFGVEGLLEEVNLNCNLKIRGQSGEARVGDGGRKSCWKGGKEVPGEGAELEGWVPSTKVWK